MRDVILLAVLVGFFALTALYVRWADHLVGADDDLRSRDASADDARTGLVESGVER